MNKLTRFPKEVRERVVRMVFEHTEEHGSQWATIQSVAGKLGMSPETLRKWVRQAERDGGLRPGLTADERTRMKEMERENRELRKASRMEWSKFYA